MAAEVLLIEVVAVLAVWGLLGVLLIALVVVLKLLQSIRGWLERIAMGVRAIEVETRSLAPEAARLKAWLADRPRS